MKRPRSGATSRAQARSAKLAPTAPGPSLAELRRRARQRLRQACRLLRDAHREYLAAQAECEHLGAAGPRPETGGSDCHQPPGSEADGGGTGPGGCAADSGEMRTRLALVLRQNEALERQAVRLLQLLDDVATMLVPGQSAGPPAGDRSE